jgi:phosphatidate cytidylyltransferase
MVSAIVIVALFADNPKGYIQRVALGTFSYLLFGVCLGHFSYLANDRLGAPIQLAILLCVEMNDIFAYCSGKLIGRRKLAPQTSPKKTIGGALGALVLTSALFATLAHFIFAGSASTAPFTFTLGVFLAHRTIGDLVMSSIKRDPIKDTWPRRSGHGGLRSLWQPPVCWPGKCSTTPIFAALESIRRCAFTGS